MKLTTHELKALAWLAENKSNMDSIHDIVAIRDEGDVGWLDVIASQSRRGSSRQDYVHYIVSPLGNVYAAKWNNERAQWERDMEKDIVVARETLGISV